MDFNLSKLTNNIGIAFNCPCTSTLNILVIYGHLIKLITISIRQYSARYYYVKIIDIIGSFNYNITAR